MSISREKCFKQMPRRLEELDPAPYGWLSELGELVPKLLQLNDDDKANFIEHLERHAGPDSMYSQKDQLHATLNRIYVTLASEKSTADTKTALAQKLFEGIKNCSPGFHNRANEAVQSLSQPENLDDLLSVLRHSIVSNVASQEVGYDGEVDVHVKNSVYVLACYLGYGVRPFNEKDAHQGYVDEDKMQKKLEEAFNQHYTLFSILNHVVGELKALAKYRGRDEKGYHEPDYRDILSSRLAKSFNITYDNFFVEVDDEDGITATIVDYDWAKVILELVNKMLKEGYFTLPPKQVSLLLTMASGETPCNFDPEALQLFATPDELVQALVLFKECKTDIKTAVVHFYLLNSTPEDQDSLLEKMEKCPELYKELQSDSLLLRDKYLSKAVRENKLDKVEELVKSGADINPHILDLVKKHKKHVLKWLKDDAALRATITRDGLQAIAETLIQSKKGRQILLTDERLRGMWSVKEGFFAPVNPLVQQFLQHVIYGEQAQAEEILKILQNHPQAVLKLLTTKSKVKDYSGREIFGTALQLALGAEDVRYHEDEICMVEMLTPYIKSLPDGEKIMAEQIAEQFPEGYEEQEQQRIKADEAALRAVVDAIFAADTNAHVHQRAFDRLEAQQTFFEYLKPKGVIKTGKHFNAQLLKAAFYLYDKKYAECLSSRQEWEDLYMFERIIGHIQRYLPACYAQAFCTGISGIVEGGKKLSRSLEFKIVAKKDKRDIKIVEMFPLKGDSNIYDHLLGCGGHRANQKKYFEKKRRTMEKLMPQRGKKSGKWW